MGYLIHEGGNSNNIGESTLLDQFNCLGAKKAVAYTPISFPASVFRVDLTALVDGEFIYEFSHYVSHSDTRRTGKTLPTRNWV